MNDLITTKEKIRIKSGFGNRTYTVNPSSALLLDRSGSMNTWIESGRSKSEALIDLYKRFPKTLRSFWFDHRFGQVSCDGDLEPEGDTYLAAALLKIKALNVSHVILITDGKPNESDQEVLDAAKGLKVDVLYVGPPPAPRLLYDLCKQTGGSMDVCPEMLMRSNKMALESKIKGLLA